MGASGGSSEESPCLVLEGSALFRGKGNSRAGGMGRIFGPGSSVQDEHSITRG